MSAVKELEKLWTGRTGTDNPSKEECSHIVSCKDLFAELALLCSLSMDRRFVEARTLIGNACVEAGLTDGVGNWRKGVRPEDELPSPDYACAVDRLLSRQISRTEAFARVAVRYQVRAGSFTGAMKAVERAWRKARQDGGSEKSRSDKTG